MNILYISSDDGRPWAGPTYSVPSQIRAQSEIDNVLWYNLYKRTHPEWVSKEWVNLPYYRDLVDCPSGKISDLPAPFNKPDLVVLEQFYCYGKTSIPKQIMRMKVPYIIIPRGEMTKDAQKRHSLKKKICNHLFFYRFARRATAIQFLTKQEASDSGEEWNKNRLVISNGVNIPKEYKEKFSEGQIKAVVIGRIEPYQKGLDLLIDACEKCKSMLTEARMTIDIYGPDRFNRLEEMKAVVKEKQLNSIISFHDAVYDEEKKKVLLNSDVFIVASRFEGHPMALIEALSYGVPALVTTGSNMRVEIEEADAGWGADITVEGIEEAILNMINERTLFKQKGKNACELAKQYSWSFLAQNSHEKYMTLLD